MLNDVAIAIKVLLRDTRAVRFLIIDCDVHQGNGTAYIFNEYDHIFTFSMHGAKNYTLFKESSDIDIELRDNTTDDEYLDLLEDALLKKITIEPDLISYLAGADPYENGSRLAFVILNVAWNSFDLAF